MSVANEASDESGVENLAAEMSFIHRVRMTPWGDLCRLRLSGRFDVEGRIAGSGLPSENCVLVRNVMKRVRLWRGERVEVVEELIVHFQDGIEAGVCAEKLVASFGDEKQAATLIRRSKKRQRSRSWLMLMKLFKGVAVLLACFVVWYVGALFYYFSGAPVVSEDYVAQMTAKARSVPEGERAWPVYRGALVAMKSELEILEGLGGDLWNPKGEHWADTVAFLEEHQVELASIRRGAALAGLGYVASHMHHPDDAELWPEQAVLEPSSEVDRDLLADTVLGVLLPHLGVIRDLARPLSGDAYLAAELGDGARVAADVRALLGVAEQVRETPTLISDLVSISIAGLTFGTLNEILSTNAAIFSSDELRELAHEIGTLEGGDHGVLGVRLNSERCMVYDLMQRIYTDDGKGGGHLSPEGLRALRSLTSMTSGGGGPISDFGAVWEFSDALVPVAGLVMANRRELLIEYDSWMDRIVAEARLPLWERPHQGVETALEMKHDETLWMTKYFMIWTLIPALSRAGMQESLIRMRRDAVVTALALELWRRDHGGAWPEELAPLVPQYLPALPMDQFTGEALGYRVRADGKVVVYGVGLDLDDDGGVEPDETLITNYQVNRWMHPEQVAAEKAADVDRIASGAQPALADGDWVLWESGGAGDKK